MGYMLSSIAHLPIDDHIELYIFVINGKWRGGYYEIIERNFAKIAREIGPRAVIAKGLEEQVWSEQLAQKYLGKEHREILQLLPAILITDAHPERLTESSLRLFVPLHEVQKRFGDFDVFFDSLTRLARDRDQEFLQRFQRKEDFIRAGLNLVELKPNLFGVGVNVNAFVKRFLRRGGKSHLRQGRLGS